MYFNRKKEGCQLDFASYPSTAKRRRYSNLFINNLCERDDLEQSFSIQLEEVHLQRQLL